MLEQDYSGKNSYLHAQKYHSAIVNLAPCAIYGAISLWQKLMVTLFRLIWHQINRKNVLAIKYDFMQQDTGVYFYVCKMNLIILLILIKY